MNAIGKKQKKCSSKPLTYYLFEKYYDYYAALVGPTSCVLFEVWSNALSGITTPSTVSLLTRRNCSDASALPSVFTTFRWMLTKENGP